MLVKDLLADRSWIQAEREAFEAKVPPERRESRLFQTGMDTAVALMENTPVYSRISHITLKNGQGDTVL